MIQDKLSISPSPHLWGEFSVRKIMYIVVIALIFPAAAGVYFFGYYALSMIAVSVITAVLTEYERRN